VCPATRKSLPLSDTATVLSKLVMAAVVVPALTVAAVLATNLLVAFILSVRLSGFEQLHIWSTVWQPGVWLNAHGQVLYTLVLSTLWYLPIYAWFLLCSAWAGRSVILWASLPPIFGVILEHFMFGTEYVAGLLADRFIGWSRYTHLAQNPSPTDSDVVTWSKEFSGVVDLTAFLTSPGLWGGLIVAALFIWATIMLRRHKAAG